MALSAEHISKFAALHRQLWRFHMSEKISSGTKYHKQITSLSSFLYVKCKLFVCKN